MKRKFVNAILFGALIAASTSVVQSCKDYDDDIDNLQTEITTSAEDLTSLIDEKVANVQKEITSLESQIPALEEAYKAADAALNTAIENATNDAKGYADIQAAEAQTAAIAAAQNAVEQAKSELQASLDAANKIIDEQGKTVSSLLEADKTLTSGIEAAQAQADKAYALAEQASQTAAENKAEIEKLSTDLGKIKETLNSQITIFGEQISDILATANQNKADIEAQEAALAQVKADNEKALQALGNEDEELRKLIEANQTSIETTQKDIEELKKSVADNLAAAQLYAESLVNGAKKELQDQIDNVNIDITTLKTQYSNLEGEINQLKADFASDLNDAINGVNGEIDGLELKVNGITTDLTSLSGRVDVAEDDIEYLKAALEELLGSESGDGDGSGENPGGTIEALEGRIKANEDNISSINDSIASINENLLILSQNLANMITNIIVQDTAQLENVYAKVTRYTTNPGEAGKIYYESNSHKVYFPYKGASGASTLEMNQYNVERNGGYLYLTINPTNVNFEDTPLMLENSLGESANNGANNSYAWSLDELDQSQRNTPITRSGLENENASSNGLYQAKLILDQNNKFDAPATNDKVAYAVVTEYKTTNNKTNEDGTTEKETKTHKVYSKYEISLNTVEADHLTDQDIELKGLYVDGTTPAGSGTGCDLKFKVGVNENLGGYLVMSPERETPAKAGDKVYMKYLTCVKACKSQTPTTNDENLVNSMNANAGLNQALDENNEAFDKVLINKNIENGAIYTFAYYIWNYDGSIYKKEFNVIFTKVLIAEQTLAWSNEPTSKLTRVEFEGDPKFNTTACMTSARNVWVSNATKVKVEGNLNSMANNAFKNIEFYDNADNVVKDVMISGVTSSMENINVNDIAKMTLTYDPSAVEYGKTYTIPVVFYNEQNNEVNTVNIKFTMNRPTKYDNNIVLIEAAFNGNQTTAWAQYDQNNDGYAYYDINGSIANTINGAVERLRVFDHCYVRFNDPTDYTRPENSAYQPSQLPTPRDYNMIVPNQAVVDEFVYKNFESGIEYYFSNIWEATKAFDIVFKSPIKYAEAKFENNLTVLYNGGELRIGDSRITCQDPSTATTKEINFFGSAADVRIDNVSVEFAEPGNSNNALIGAATVESDGSGIKITTTNTVAMQRDTDIKFNLKVVDKFGCTSYKPFTVKVVKNDSGNGNN